MAKLSSKSKRSMKSSSFALPSQRKFPIPDASHGRNALARAASKSPAVRAKVSAAVHRKFPGIKQSKGSKSRGLINRS